MSRLQSVDATSIHPADALITNSAAGQLDPRQNNPQDCSNLIIASVDRATVEISRTIIRLNATFSQQLDQARISASNGIKSAQDSATSTIQIVVQSASIATSSAFSSVRIANLAVTSANAALTNANIALTSANAALNTANLALTSALSASTSDLSRLSLASSSDVSRLSSSSSSDVARLSASLRLAEASLAAAQGGLGASIDSHGQPGIVVNLNAAQIAGIVIGAVIFAILLGVTAGFVVIRMRRSRRSNQINEKDEPSNSDSHYSRQMDDEKKSIVLENPFLSAEEIRSPAIDAQIPDLKESRRRRSEKPAKADNIQIVSAESKLRRNFSLPRNQENRKRLSPRIPESESTQRADATDSTSHEDARKQATEEAPERPTANILESATIAAEPGQSPPHASVNTEKLPLTLDAGQEDMETGAELGERVDATSPNEQVEDEHGPLQKTVGTELQEDLGAEAENPFDDAYAVVPKASREQTPEVGRRHVSPLRRNPVLNVVQDDEPVPPLPSSPYQNRAISPLRRNPVFPSSTDDDPIPPLPAVKLLPDRERTLSPLRRNPVVNIAEDSEPVQPLPTSPLKQRAISPLRRNPVFPISPEDDPIPPLPVVKLLLDRERTLSPLRRNPVVPESLEKEESLPPPPPPVLEDQQPESPKLPSPTPTSPVMSEPAPRSPSLPVVDRNSFHLDLVPSTQTPEASGPPSPIEPTATTPAAQEDGQRLSSLDNIALLIEEVSSVSASDESRDVSLLRSEMSRHSIDTSTRISEVTVEWKGLEDAEAPQEIEHGSEEHTEQDLDERSDEYSDGNQDEDSDEQSEADSEETDEPPEVDERAARGRSMIRTSDIIQARLSAIARERAEVKVPDAVSEEASNMPSSAATSPERSRRPAQVILKSNPLPTALLRPAQAQSKVESNAQFSQAVLMFKSLESRNPQHAAAATSEVNHRTLAGIFVPATLREEAVRNVSKSRDRGKSRARDRGK